LRLVSRYRRMELGPARPFCKLLTRSRTRVSPE
jgi:hypothetical protein